MTTHYTCDRVDINYDNYCALIGEVMDALEIFFIITILFIVVVLAFAISLKDDSATAIKGTDNLMTGNFGINKPYLKSATTQTKDNPQSNIFPSEFDDFDFDAPHNDSDNNPFNGNYTLKGNIDSSQNYFVDNNGSFHSVDDGGAFECSQGDAFNTDIHDDFDDPIGNTFNDDISSIDDNNLV